MRQNLLFVLLIVSVPSLFPLIAFAGESEPKATIDPNNPPMGLFSDEWLELYLSGGKIGYGHSQMSRTGDVIESTTQMHIQINRGTVSVKMEVKQSSVEQLDGTPVSFFSRQQMGTFDTTQRGVVEDGKVKITTEQFGIKQTREFDYPAGSVMAWGAFRESLLRGVKPGLEYTLKSYAPDLRLDGPVDMNVKTKEWQEVVIGGVKERGLYTLVQMVSPIGELEMKTWVLEDGTVLKSIMPVPGLDNIEMLRSNQKQAMAEFVPVEIFVASSIKVDKRIDRNSVNKISYKIRLKEGEELPRLPLTGMQKVKALPDGAVEITVTRQSHKRQRGQKESATWPLSFREYLEGNLMISIEDPQLRDLAKKAAGGEKEPFVLGDKLRRFVSNYVEAKNLNIGFATASEVARQREGDCTEHGVLLAALGRINGLPSRVVVGLAYVPNFLNQQNVFGYHMWTQFYIDGQWYDFDAALEETVCSPARIALGVSSLKNSGVADLSLPLLKLLGSIELEVLSTE